MFLVLRVSQTVEFLIAWFVFALCILFFNFIFCIVCKRWSRQAVFGSEANVDPWSPFCQSVYSNLKAGIQMTIKAVSIRGCNNYWSSTDYVFRSPFMPFGNIQKQRPSKWQNRHSLCQEILNKSERILSGQLCYSQCQCSSWKNLVDTILVKDRVSADCKYWMDTVQIPFKYKIQCRYSASTNKYSANTV